MLVSVIGHTCFEQITANARTNYKWLDNDWLPTETDADLLAEFAGRACYQSWSKPNPATATNKGYHNNTLDHQHYSIYEHASITLYVEGVSRALTHELVRHRHLSFSQLSQRFVNEEDAKFIVPPTLAEDAASRGVENPSEQWAEEFEDVLDFYKDLVGVLVAKGHTRKQAREAARAVLPNCTETKIVVTGNIRAWREFILKRHNVHADAEIRAFAGEVLRIVRRYAPNSVQDLQETPYE